LVVDFLSHPTAIDLELKNRRPRRDRNKTLLCSQSRLLFLCPTAAATAAAVTAGRRQKATFFFKLTPTVQQCAVCTSDGTLMYKYCFYFLFDLLVQ